MMMIIIVVVVVIADVVSICLRDIERAGGSRPAYLFIYLFIYFFHSVFISPFVCGSSFELLIQNGSFPHLRVFVSSADLAHTHMYFFLNSTHHYYNNNKHFIK